MRAKKIYEMENFTRGRDPYKKLKIGQYKQGDLNDLDDLEIESLDDLHDYFDPPQKKYIEAILRGGPSIRAAHHDKWFRNGGWNGLMDAISEYEKNNGIVQADFDDFYERDIDIMKLISKEI